MSSLPSKSKAKKGQRYTAKRSERWDRCTVCGDPFFCCPLSITNGNGSKSTYASKTCCGNNVPCSHFNELTHPQGKTRTK